VISRVAIAKQRVSGAENENKKNGYENHVPDGG
jgi:hypothetical protein